MSHINSNKLDNSHQSAYKTDHSTETTLLLTKIRFVSVWHSLFDIIDHNTLLGYIKSWFGLCRTVYRWFVSYLRYRRQAIKIDLTLSDLSKLFNGIPQGSVLGPLLFSIYTTWPSKIISFHPDRNSFFYTYSTQLYVCLSQRKMFKVKTSPLFSCWYLQNSSSFCWHC